VVERGFAWLHAFKRLRIRYERRGDIHLGLMQRACALICYRRLRSFGIELQLDRWNSTACAVQPAVATAPRGA
jgi:hypothetical protein